MPASAASRRGSADWRSALRGRAGAGRRSRRRPGTSAGAVGSWPVGPRAKAAEGLRDLLAISAHPVIDDPESQVLQQLIRGEDESHECLSSGLVARRLGDRYGEEDGGAADVLARGSGIGGLGVEIGKPGVAQ